MNLKEGQTVSFKMPADELAKKEYPLMTGIVKRDYDTFDKWIDIEVKKDWKTKKVYLVNKDWIIEKKNPG